jgi:hypothetical protein
MEYYFTNIYLDNLALNFYMLFSFCKNRVQNGLHRARRGLVNRNLQINLIITL